MFSEIASFAQRLGQDAAVVRAWVELECSDGQVEGQVNRQKAIKRTMFGRARFDLLACPRPSRRVKASWKVR